MSVFFNHAKILDPKTCWDDWIAEGSLTKVRAKYWREGLISERTGTPPNESAIQKSAYSWAVENITIAKERFEYECQLRAIAPTEEMWKSKLFTMGKLLFYQRPGRMSDFVERHGLQGYATAN